MDFHRIEEGGNWEQPPQLSGKLIGESGKNGCACCQQVAEAAVANQEREVIWEMAAVCINSRLLPCIQYFPKSIRGEGQLERHYVGHQPGQDELHAGK